MTPLGKRLIARIMRVGPIPVADYMAECLLHPKDGYYTTQDPLGTRGDFTTAPEISQMFGELIGLWLAQVWLAQGRPAPFLLVDLGPGRGTLMADVMRAASLVPGFCEAARLQLVEASPLLCAKQAAALSGFRVRFCDRISSLDDAPLFLVANEFFDALPIRQFVRGVSGWHERQIGTDGRRLIWGLSPEAPVAALADRWPGTARGQMVEVSGPARACAAEIGQRISEFGGVALIVDYGSWQSLGNTLQAVAGHASVNPLDSPGQADLSAHVAFHPLARAAAPARASALVSQGVFLERLGIAQRTARLAAGLTGPARHTHMTAHRRLTHPDEMGTLFKVMGLSPPHAPPLLGLEPVSSDGAPDGAGNDAA